VSSTGSSSGKPSPSNAAEEKESSEPKTHVVIIVAIVSGSASWKLHQTYWILFTSLYLLLTPRPVVFSGGCADFVARSGGDCVAHKETA